MASTWEIVSSALVLLLFLGAAYAFMLITRSVSSSTTSTKTSLQSRGVTYQDGRLSVKTDRAAPSREEYIASTQRAFERGAKTMSLHPDAFKMGKSRSPSSEPAAAPLATAPSDATSSSTPDKKGFQRTKKLA